MQLRRLGPSELEVSAVTFGAYPVTGWSWDQCDPDSATRCLQTAFEAGIRSVDTAPVYSFGLSEELVGSALRGRDDVIVMTKVGLNWQENVGPHAFDARKPDGELARVRRNSRPASIRREVDASLQRLQRERIDLVQVHAHDPSTPIPETMGALAELRLEGKLREIGVSNYDVDQLRTAQAALGEVLLVSVQPPYSLLTRDIERTVLPHAHSQSIGVLAYSPLDQGLLSGKMTPEKVLAQGDGRNRRASFQPENRRRVIECLAMVVQPIASARSISLAQTVIAWTHAQAGVTSALVGARTQEQARENATAASVVLDADELASIRAGFEQLELIPGKRPSLIARIRGKLHKLRR
ncbi:MAG: aryl-alcohol dehydrogenase-like predicted oxidoreductase [Planctomycetota bacterium]|jgi:aryl-alcohol dehydrogenase-like predicted oxidoreductase